MHVVSTVQTQIPVLQGSSYFSPTLSHLLILLRNVPNNALSSYELYIRETVKTFDVKLTEVHWHLFKLTQITHCKSCRLADFRPRFLRND